MGLYKHIFVERVRKKDLPKIPAKDREKILKAIDGLRLNPRPEKAFRLTNREEYRLRQGNYRILYTIEDEIRVVEIRQIGHRRSVYDKVKKLWKKAERRYIQMQEMQAKVGVGVLVVKNGKVLLGKRKNTHGADEYGGPGGHLEYGETMEQTALREIAEECGVKVKNLRMLCVSDLLTYFPKHYLDIGFTAEWESGEPKVLEPHKLEKWEWFDIDTVPKNLFGCVGAYIESYKTGKTHFTFPRPREEL